MNINTQHAGWLDTRLSIGDVKDILRLIQDGESHTSIARHYGVSLVTVTAIATGRTWTHINIETGETSFPIRNTRPESRNS